MRETRFYEFQTDAAATNTHRYEVPVVGWAAGSSHGRTNPPQRPPVRAGGLAGGLYAWRVEDARTLVLEHIVERSLVRISVPGALCCAPVVVAGSSGSGGANPCSRVVVVLAFVAEAGCEVARLNLQYPTPSPHDSRDTDAPRIRRLQTVLEDADVVSALMYANETDPTSTCFYGTLNGHCGRIVEGPDTLELSKFDVPAHGTERLDDDVTSTTSASDLSRRSFTTQASNANGNATPSLFSRLLSTPRSLMPSQTPSNAPETPGVWHTPRSSRTSRSIFSTPRSSRRATTLPSISSTERVEALRLVDIGELCLVVLHGSGRICTLLQTAPGVFQYAGETKLGLTLAKDYSRNILLDAGHEQLAAVLTVDEEPQANSVRVFSVMIKRISSVSVNVICRQVVKRSGPIERVVSAVMLGDDVIVGTETGTISGPMSSVGADDKGVGLPLRLLWSAIEDVEQATGLGGCINRLVEDPRERLLAAHRYSVGVVSKALRFTNTAASRAVVEKHVREMEMSEDSAAAFTKAIARADFLCVDMDMPLHSMQTAPGVGIVVTRNCGLSVFRTLYNDEKSSIGNAFPTYSQFQDELTGPVAWLAAAHGSVQVFFSALSNMSNADPNTASRQFMTKQALRYSNVHKHMSLTDVVVADCARKDYIARATGAHHVLANFSSAIFHIQSTLQPSGESMRFLFDAGEMNALHKLALFCGDMLPVSCYFCSGLWWLHQLKTLRQQNEELNGVASMADDEDMQDDKESALLTPKLALDRAYGMLVAAARVASSSDGLDGDDVDCVMHIAAIPRSKVDNADDDMRDEIGADSPVSGMEDDPMVDNLGYWLLERTVRQFEKAGSPKNAAAAALEAMKQAPNRELYETMRSAAFGRFLDAKNLSTALEAMLKPPFETETDTDNALVTKSEASALRDGMALFVNAVAEDGMMRWLVERDLPEPLTSLTSITLERRARAAEPLDMEMELAAFETAGDTPRGKYEYEYIFAWHVKNKNQSAAAAIALEWGERLSNEGLKTILQANHAHTYSPAAAHDSQLRLFLAWANMKVRAYSLAHASVHMLDEKRRYIVRSRFSISGQPTETDGVVSPQWAARRNLLAKAQATCAARMLSDPEPRRIQCANFLAGAGTTCLADDQHGVAWAVETLCSTPGGARVAAELAAAWVDETGPQLLESVVRRAIRDTPNLDAMLLDVYHAAPERNWSLVALEAALVHPDSVPQWLVDQAAWGVQRDTHHPALVADIPKRGDVAAVARAFLRAGAPLKAADVLLMEFKRADNDSQSNKTGIPFAAIDATIIALGAYEGNDLEYEYYYDKLREITRERVQDSRKNRKIAEENWRANEDTIMAVAS